MTSSKTKLENIEELLEIVIQNQKKHEKDLNENWDILQNVLVLQEEMNTKLESMANKLEEDSKMINELTRLMQERKLEDMENTATQQSSAMSGFSEMLDQKATSVQGSTFKIVPKDIPVSQLSEVEVNPEQAVSIVQHQSEDQDSKHATLTGIQRQILTTNAISCLNEICPGLSYQDVSRTGPDHCPLFTVSVNMHGTPYTGTGSDKKRAKHAAAQAALKALLFQANKLT